MLYDHFPSSIHEDLIIALGLELPTARQAAEPPAPPIQALTRDPKFRDTVLTAYEHRCAFSGFRAALGGSFFGCEAAHVRWHSQEGPDLVSNGIALEPTIHKLFDLGAWTLTDDHHILVSSKFTGTDETIARIRDRHNKPLREPLNEDHKIDRKFIQWHREKDLGGVFRGPALS